MTSLGTGSGLTGVKNTGFQRPDTTLGSESRGPPVQVRSGDWVGGIRSVRPRGLWDPCVCSTSLSLSLPSVLRSGHREPATFTQVDGREDWRVFVKGPRVLPPTTVPRLPPVGVSGVHRPGRGRRIDSRGKSGPGAYSANTGANGGPGNPNRFRTNFRTTNPTWSSISLRRQSRRGSG